MTIPKGARVEEGHKKLDLEFRLIAAPRPTITWFRDDGNGFSPIEESDKVHMSMFADVHLYIVALEIKDVRPEDEGQYRIEAKNKEGEAAASVLLEVNSEWWDSDYFSLGIWVSGLFCMVIGHSEL